MNNDASKSGSIVAIVRVVDENAEAVRGEQ